VFSIPAAPEKIKRLVKKTFVKKMLFQMHYFPESLAISMGIFYKYQFVT